MENGYTWNMKIPQDEMKYDTRVFSTARVHCILHACTMTELVHTRFHWELQLEAEIESYGFWDCTSK